jgi:hypothetical protein
LKFSIILFGDEAISSKDDILKCIELLYIKDGDNSVEFILESAEEENSIIDIDNTYIKDDAFENSTVRLVFDTPFITKSYEKLTTKAFLVSCTSRITSMINSTIPGEKFDYHRFLDEADNIKISNHEFYSNKYIRSSTRDNKEHKLNSMIGYVEFTGNLSNTINMLKVASNFNIGKSCTMGFGKFHLETVDAR